MKTCASAPLLFLLVLSLAACPAPAQSRPTYESDPAFQKLKLEAQGNAKNASLATFVAGNWKKANEKAGGHCMECFEGMITAAIHTRDTKRAVQYAHDMDTAAEQPVDHTRAKLMLARAVLAGVNNKKPDTQLLEDAHQALEAAKPVTISAYFYDGRVLSLLHKDEGAAAAFRNYAEKTRRDDVMLVRAQHFAARPELARLDMAPALEVTTLAGKRFNLDNMNGRVVLIDFWATWCGPCKQELPHMKKLAQQYAGQPFELISVSWDADETKWKDFIAANGMTWNQFRDADHSLSTIFGISAIPHYFTIDSNGVLAAENLGSGSNIDGRIRKLVQQAQEAAPAVATVTGPKVPEIP